MEDKTSSSIFSNARSETPDTIRRISDEDAKSMTSKPRDSMTSLPSTTKKSLSTRAASASSSPFASRESSPVRPPLKSNTSSARSTGPGRSRKNSVQEISPSRGGAATSNPPSAAATQRALSSASIPTLYPGHPESVFKTQVAPKSINTSEIKETPRWPLSPRLRSPPPNNKHSIISPRKADQDLPLINVPRTEQQEGKQATTDTESEDLSSLSGMRTPARGASGSTLETVQEISLPNTPGLGLDGLLEKAHNGRLAEQDIIENAFNKNMKSKGSIGTNESGSESGGKSETKMRSSSLVPSASSSRPGAPPVKAYSAASGMGRGKSSSDGTARNMTVETETVSSIPQVAVGGPGGGNNGSIRTKPSSETIRPKKEKKKTARKAPSVNAGTASSKADIFEAKVASAVDEANSSDSEETFVYESNPPDANDRPRRFHSRTPSVTSMASQADQRNGVRSMMDTGHSVAMKKSMKFANSYNSNAPEVTTTEDDGKGTARSNMGTGRGTTHHHHIGRWGRNGGNGHPSLFDNESPFPNAAKSKMGTNGNGNGNGTGNTSQPSSPRTASRQALYGGKKSSPISSGYDMDDGADDERTPLMSTVRSGRSGRTRRPLSSLRQLEHQAARHNRSFFARFAGCIVISLMIVMVFTGAIGFMFATTQPLTEVKVLALKNVLASEQEVIFDMQVTARNRNIVVVTIDTSDLVIFAKSKYAGTDSEWWKQPSKGSQRQRGVQKRDDEYFDPPDVGDPSNSPNFEIGNVLEFKSPLMFEGSPFHHEHSISKGQIRISDPGNSTLPSGSERWGRIVQHEFELIVRGTLQYTLPLTQRVRSVPVEGRVTVKPNAADQDPDTLHPLPDRSDVKLNIIG